MREVETALPRRRAMSVAGLGIAMFVLPNASAAASPGGVQTLACEVPTFTPIPFLAQGESTTVGDVTVTATVNTAIDSAPSYPANGYLHAGPKLGKPGEFDAGASTTLAFSPGLTRLRATTAYHADGENSNVVEVYTLTGRTLTGTTLFTETITDINTTVTLPGSGEFGAGMAQLEIVYSATGEPKFQYASIIYLEQLAC